MMAKASDKPAVHIYRDRNFSLPNDQLFPVCRLYPLIKAFAPQI